LIKTIVPANTEMILLGFSKNLGIPELRAGIMFSRKPIQHLEVFQKVFGYVGLAVFRTITSVCQHMPIETLAVRLKEYQTKFCSMNTEFNPSDSALLATTNDRSYKFYKRPNGIIRIPLGESITYCIENKLI
jgi:aspartate/methionine/tyrosine aminotransferase